MNIDTKTSISVFITFVSFILLIVIICMISKPETFVGSFDSYVSGVNENLKINQPQAFEEELLSSPCKPYSGCLYPMPNPINIKTGKRDSEIPKGVKAVTCKKAWRDCSAYSDCVEGTCKPKSGIYKGF